MARQGASRVPTVLLVDGDHDDRAMYAEYLRAQQFRAVEIDNTADALALARTTDIVVTGIRVPGPFDGVELIRRLRAGERTIRKPIIVVTACALETDLARASLAGCDAFLPKPCLPDTLVAEIRRVMASRSRARAQPIHAAKTRTWRKRIA
jgi:two-component system cell cycle response regulator DivK